MTFCFCVLLLMEPDFGAAAVLFATAFGLLFIAGAQLRWVLLCLVTAGAGFAALMVSADYRMKRLTCFLNPWAHAQECGYQPVQSLIAIGRGEWTGVGLGESVQKLFYLPEAHTDFLLAVIAEELGFLGVAAVIGLFVWVVLRAFAIGRRAAVRERHFAALVAQGIGIWIGFQALINMGVNMGLLPTKGLTLPLMSFGGTGLLANSVAIALLLRIDWENRQLARGLRA